ncbi:hypothetical protein RRF57_010386 [Xylaria bambusicola]|uniref:Uncharacterized protein n=1 Tax=Xylaria bambusicola TaxID=326684 RepID=A0AAN7ZCZ0_9PEZI
MENHSHVPATTHRKAIGQVEIAIATSGSGKVLATGANTGLGYRAALECAALGASRLILVVRSREKGEAAKARIARETKCTPDSIEVMTVGLSLFSSVKEFVKCLSQQVPYLHAALLCWGTI